MIPMLCGSPRRSLPSAALAIPLCLAACHGSVLVHVPVEPPPPPPPPPPVYWESEPNDEAWFAPWFGWLYPGEAIWVQGHSGADGTDPEDALEFTGYGPARIDFTLFVDDPWTDLDVWLYDPWLDEFVAAFTFPFGDEQGTFWLDGSADFQLVVVPASGASSWTLEVFASGNTLLAEAPPDALDVPTPVVLAAHTAGREALRASASGSGR